MPLIGRRLQCPGGNRILDGRARSVAPQECVVSLLDAIGNTPLIELTRIVPAGCGRIFAKLESANPTGSMKDRMARAAVTQAVAAGRLRPGGTAVEYTAGTTGISLAMVCSVLGYPLDIVFSDAFSIEKRRTMEAFSARIVDVPSEGGQINERLIKGMIAKADELSRQPGYWYCDQLNNHDAIGGYLPMGEEIWRQTGGKLDAFVHAVGTAHAIHGATEALWSHAPGIEVVAVEPQESAVLSGQASGSHKIEGIGIGFVPPLWHREQVNRIETVPTEDAKAMARRLAREEGVFAGTSTGANVVAALRVGQRLGPKSTVVTIVCDSGLRYLSTDLFAA